MTAKQAAGHSNPAELGLVKVVMRQGTALCKACHKLTSKENFDVCPPKI
jgi:hypothetical protein